MKHELIILKHEKKAHKKDKHHPR